MGISKLLDYSDIYLAITKIYTSFIKTNWFNAACLIDRLFFVGLGYILLMTMKKITLFLLLLAFTQFVVAQIINEPANWPNPNWTTSGNYNAAGLLADPAIDSSFSFDDDEFNGIEN